MSVIDQIKEERDAAFKNMNDAFDKENFEEGEFWERKYNSLQDQVDEYYKILINGTVI